MRKLHDTMESNVRALRSLGINYEHFEPLLVPILSQQTFSGLQHVFSVTILRFPRRLEDEKLLH